VPLDPEEPEPVPPPVELPFIFENVTETDGSKEKSIVARVLSGLVTNPCIEEITSLKS
jgi:hypothetical protein